MTVVLEDQVKTIAAEIIEQHLWDLDRHLGDDEIEDVVRAVIAMYDISSIARLEVPVSDQR